MSFFPFRGPLWTPKPRKTRGFLIAPRWNSGTPRGPKHRKTRCFLTPWAEYTVNYKGSGDPEVTPRWPPWGRRLGRHATITFGYQPKASGKDTARLGSGRRPDWRATAHAADPVSGWWIFFLKVGMKAHWQVHFGWYQGCCAEPWLTPWSFWPTANQWQAWFHSTAVKWEGDFLHTVDGINHAPVDR